VLLLALGKLEESPALGVAATRERPIVKRQAHVGQQQIGTRRHLWPRSVRIAQAQHDAVIQP
jgi:hypothetical protein